MMDLLLTYDVDTTSPEGRRRLRKVAKLCEGYGTRVQQSVFEIATDDIGLLKLLAAVKSLINTDTDSIRIYRLPRNGFEAVRTMGTARLLAHRDDFVI
ncbi:CRISPR-associated endonuclease Cas2 [Embleya sp. NPDC020630]|uniref:CRISPR-associated endonuclease Cas2 n=1 Tax=Embleya sp. NPDC020630 TaxID=3363979 RepID=UPI00379D0243